MTTDFNGYFKEQLFRKHLLPTSTFKDCRRTALNSFTSIFQGFWQDTFQESCVSRKLFSRNTFGGRRPPISLKLNSFANIFQGFWPQFYPAAFGNIYFRWLLLISLFIRYSYHYFLQNSVWFLYVTRLPLRVFHESRNF